MDELDRLRRAHAAVPAPDATTTRAARLRLRGAFDRPHRPSRRRAFRLAAAVAVAATGLALALALWPAQHAGPAGPSTAVAARACLQPAPGPAGPCLDALGDQAAADDVLAGGRVFYRRDLWTQGVTYVGPDGTPQAAPRGPGVFAVARAGSQELWVAPDRSGRLSYGKAERPYLPSVADERAWRAAGRPDLDRLFPDPDERDLMAPRRFGPGELDELLLGNGELHEVLPDGDPLRDLPTESAALARMLRRLAWEQRTRISGEGPCAADLHDCSAGTRRNIDSVYGSDITTLLRYPFASPPLRRALLRVLGDVPGARRLGAIQDPAGRRAAAILLPDPVNDGRNVVVFDLATGRLLADGRSEDRTLATLRWNDVYDLRVAGVEKIGARPG